MLSPRDTATSTPITGNRSYLTMLAFGVGFYLGWQTVNISPTLYPQPHNGVYESIGTAYHIETLLFVVLLVLLARAARTRAPLYRHSALAWGSGLLMCLGSFCVALCGWLLPQPVLPGVIAGQALLGCKAGLLVLWGELLCAIRLRDALPCVAGAYAVSFALCLLVANLNDTAAIALRCIMPAISTLLFLVLRHDLLAAPQHANPEPVQNPAGPAQIPWRLFVGIGVFGAIISSSNYLSETKALVSTELYTLVAGVAVSLVVLGASLRISSERFNFTALYRLITPLIIGCLMLTLVLEPSDQWYEALSIGAAWTFFRIFTWTLWCYIAARSGTGATRAFAFGQIALTALSTAADALFSSGALAQTPLTVLVSAVVLVAVLTSALVMNEGNLVQALGPAVPADPADTPRDPKTDAALAAACTACAREQFDFSEREREIATLVLLGNDNAQIVDAIQVTESTLRTHLRNIYAKAGVHSRQELIETLATFSNASHQA